MLRFGIGGTTWLLLEVPPDSKELVNSSGERVLACTDPVTKTVYISKELYGQKRKTVIAHELGHCILFSYNLLNDLYEMTKPEFYLDMEEWVCNFLAENCQEVLYLMKRI